MFSREYSNDQVISFLFSYSKKVEMKNIFTLKNLVVLNLGICHNQKAFWLEGFSYWPGNWIINFL